ncbi:MAG: oxidoreductase [Streptomycetaceae bacterium]|nr:oxidoreductase [Streptomycetaceae bacterium]
MAKLRLTRSTWIADGIVELQFRDPEGAELAPWTPGAHLTLGLTTTLSREYSLCGDPADRYRYAVAVQREPASRGGSAHVHDTLRVGAVIDVDGPKNNFELEDAPAHLLLAGGIGITPMAAMARELHARGANWRLLYAGRSRRSMAFADELAGLGGDRVRLHADDEHGGPPDLAAELAAAPADALVYCCGPEPLLAAVEAQLDDASRLRVERFRAPAPAETTAGDAEQAFEVSCSRGTFTVQPGVSILDALRAGGVDVPSSCEEGICGTCETRVLSGEPEHRDFLLSGAERAANTVLMPCVSRSRSPRLVLDL